MRHKTNKCFFVLFFENVKTLLFRNFSHCGTVWAIPSRYPISGNNNQTQNVGHNRYG